MSYIELVIRRHFVAKLAEQLRDNPLVGAEERRVIEGDPNAPSITVNALGVQGNSITLHPLLIDGAYRTPDRSWSIDPDDPESRSADNWDL